MPCHSIYNEGSENITITAPIDYEAFCGLKKEENTMETITVDELKLLKDKGEDFALIDVRETYEYEAGNLGGVNIPLSTVQDHLDQIPKEGNVVVHCKAGGRSANAIQLLSEQYGYTNLKNLTGGALAWKSQIDPDLEVI